jgi:hypothetical protein
MDTGVATQAALKGAYAAEELITEFIASFLQPFNEAAQVNKASSVNDLPGSS